MEILRRILGRRGEPEPKSIEQQIHEESFRRRHERIKNPEYPRAPWDMVCELSRRTKRGAGDLVPVRANIRLTPDTRREDAIAAKDISILDQPSGRISAIPELVVEKGTFGVITDVDDDFPDRPYFVVTWNIINPELKIAFPDRYPYCFIPTTSFVPGETYQELDFSLIDKKAEEIGEEFASFVEEVWETRRKT